MTKFRVFGTVLFMLFSLLIPVQSATSVTRNSIDCLTPVHQTGLVLHLDAGSPCQTGSTSTWLDTSGNNKDLTFTGTPSYDATTYKSYGFNGTPFGTVPSGFADFSSGISASFYINWSNQSATWQRVIDFGGTANANLYAPQADNILIAKYGNSRDITLEFYRGAVSQGHCKTNSGTAITANVWTHYAIVVNPSGADKCKVFINGSEVTTDLDPTYSSGGPNNLTRYSNFIGESNWNTDDVFTGSISDLALYNIALTNAQVSSNYTAQTTSPPVNSVTPSISGTATYLRTISATTGTWSNTPTAHNYVWSRASTSGGTYSTISGATSSTYTLDAADVGKYLKVNVTASNAGGANSSLSPASAQITAAPTSASVSLAVGDLLFRQTKTISATPSVAGKITFRANNVIITGCKNLLSSAGVAKNCSYKPATRGKVTISVTLNPTSSAYLSSITNTSSYFVYQRSGSR
jgi:hypothetical protein